LIHNRQLQRGFSLVPPRWIQRPSLPTHSCNHANSEKSNPMKRPRVLDVRCRSVRFIFFAGLVGTVVWSAASGIARADERSSSCTTVLDRESGISETTWPNGFRLLVLPQADNPMVACAIWYSVGSRDENVGETGLSHYLEHMLFKGSKKYPKGEIDKLTQLNGGANNASTREDATEYHFSFPADRWEVALDIEADRMRNSDVQPAEFEAEKNVVLQELKSGLDDPAQVLYDSVQSAVFCVSGYHHPVIGWPEDVRRTTREQMMKYYRKHYTPDRATLVIVGGVQREAVIAKVAALFGAIPRGSVVRHELAEPPPPGETRLTLRQDTQVPRLVEAYRSLKRLAPEEPLLDLISQMLSGDKTTRLEKALVDSGIAASASCYSDTRRDDGIFVFEVEPTEGHTLDECEAALHAALATFTKEGPTPEEIARARAKLLTHHVFEQEKAADMAERLGSLAVLGDWRYHLRYPAALQAATPQAVQLLAQKVFRPGLVVVGRSLPKEEPAAGGGMAKVGRRHTANRVRATDPKGSYGARWRRPGDHRSGAAIEKSLDLKPLREVLPNGLVVLILRRATAPVFVAQLAVREGRIGEDKPGLSQMTGSLLMEGTTAHSAEEIDATIGAVGGMLATEGSGVVVKTQSKDARLALDTAFEVATKPAFGAEAIERVRAQQLVAIEEELDTPSAVAEAKFDEVIYGKRHPFGYSDYGTRKSVKDITRQQVAAHHARFFVPGNATLVIVSDQPTEAVLPLVQASFGTWAAGRKSALPVMEIPQPSARTVHIATDKEQANIYLGHIGITRRDPDFTALEVMDNVFGTGSGATDRLSKNIRDEKGLVYAVKGSVTSSAGPLPGTFQVFAATNPEDAAKTIAEMRREIGRILSEPPTADELAGAKAALRGATVASMETAADVAAVLHVCERYGLGFDWPKRHLAEIDAVTAEDVIRVAKRHIQPHALVEVVVGPESSAPAGPGHPEHSTEK